MSARTIVITCLSAVAILFVGYLLMGSNGAGSGNGSPQKPPGFTSPPKHINPAPVLAGLRAELEKANTFFELPALMKVPIPQPAPAGSADPPTTYVWVPPGEQINVNWESSSCQLTDGNYLREKGQRVDAPHTRSTSPYGETIILEGHYPRPDCLPRASPMVDIAVQSDKGKVVFATTFGQKDAKGKWQLAAAPPGFWLWGKLPGDRSVPWQCSVILTDPTGKPITSKREPVFACKEVTGGDIKEEDRHPLFWEKHLPPPLNPENPGGPPDKSIMFLKPADVPVGFDHLVIQTKSKEGQQIHVALVLSK